MRRPPQRRSCFLGCVLFFVCLFFRGEHRIIVSHTTMTPRVGAARCLPHQNRRGRNCGHLLFFLCGGCSPNPETGAHYHTVHASPGCRCVGKAVALLCLSRTHGGLKTARRFFDSGRLGRRSTMLGKALRGVRATSASHLHQHTTPINGKRQANINILRMGVPSGYVNLSSHHPLTILASSSIKLLPPRVHASRRRLCQKCSR